MTDSEYRPQVGDRSIEVTIRAPEFFARWTDSPERISKLLDFAMQCITDRNVPANAKSASKESELRAALIEILNLSQETCVTHEDQCIAATQIAQRALAKL